MDEVLKSKYELRNSTIVIQVTAEEKKQIQLAAEKAGMTVSAYCRYVLIYKE